VRIGSKLRFGSNSATRASAATQRRALRQQLSSMHLGNNLATCNQSPSSQGSFPVLFSFLCD
jgi:hypothetical protein